MNQKITIQNSKLDYWRENWSLLCEMGRNYFYDFDCMSPRLIINDYYEDLKADAVRKSHVKQFYREQLGLIINQRPAKHVYQNEIKLILTHFDADPASYLIQQCESVRQKFLTGEYFRALKDLLKTNLLSDEGTDHTFSEIKEISRNLVIELCLSGCDFAEISVMPWKILAKPVYLPDGRVHTDFPLKTRYQDFVTTDRLGRKRFHQKRFNEAVRVEVNSLTIESRLDRLDYYFGDVLDNIRLIFPVSGITTNVEINIGEVTFYNVLKKRYANRNQFSRKITASQRNEELFDRAPSEDSRVITAPAVNATVLIETRTSVINVRVAANKINRAIDLLRLYYDSEIKFTLITNRYIVCGENGEFYGNGWHDTDSAAIIRPIDVSDWEIVPEGKIPPILNSHPHTEMQTLLVSAMRWHRKAVESYSVDDKLLCYWISIESILANNRSLAGNIANNDNDLDAILEFLPSLMIIEFIPQYIEELSRIIRQTVVIPQKISKLYRLSNSRQASWQFTDLLAALPAIKTLCTSNQRHLLERIDDALQFYNEPDSTTKSVELKKKSLRSDLIHIYRHRNRIVHNAHDDENILFFLAKKAHNFSSSLIRCVLHSHMIHNRNDMPSIVNFIKGRLDTLLARLKAHEKVSLLTYNFFDSK